MSQMKDLFAGLNIQPEKLLALSQEIRSNPFAAMAKIQELGITPDMLQKMMSIAVANPQAIEEFAKEMGFSDEHIGEAKKTVRNLVKPT